MAVTGSRWRSVSPKVITASVDDEAVLRAQQAYTDGAGGASGFGV